LSYAKVEHACNPVIFKNDEYDPFTGITGCGNYPWNSFSDDFLHHIPAGKPTTTIMIYGLASGLSLAISITSLVVLVSIL